MSSNFIKYENGRAIKVSGYNKGNVDILLSTYNGSKYLDELLNSLQKQTYKNWTLIIRDDGSTDNTKKLIEQYCEEIPQSIKYIEDRQTNLGPSRGFSKLMEYTNADYIMFCDQDDIWLPDKIQKSINYMQYLEKEFPKKPLLIHTDLKVADQDLKLIDNSFWDYQRLDPNRKQLNHVLIQNIATGCTMMINKKLKEISYPVPKNAIMHDWWIALMASTYSGIYHLDDPNILYRQHNENNIGANEYSINFLIRRMKNTKKLIDKLILQGQTFKSENKDHLSEKQYQMLKSFVNLYKYNRFKRLYTVYKYKFHKHGLLRNIGFFLALFLISKEK